MRRGADHRERGFALLEVLVAVTLLGMLSVALFEGIRFSGRALQESERRIATTETLRSVRALMRQTLSSTYPAYASSNVADPRVFLEGTDTSLTVVAPLPEAIGSGIIARQHFQLAAIDGQQALLMAWTLGMPGHDEMGQERRVILAKQVGVFRLRYFGSTGPGAPAAWHATWLAQIRLPQLIEIHLELPDRGRNAVLDLVVAPRVTTNVSCVYDPADVSCRRVE